MRPGTAAVQIAGLVFLYLILANLHHWWPT